MGWQRGKLCSALFAENASGAEPCLFDEAKDPKESHRIKIKERTHQVWHAYLPDCRPGQFYGYRVYGPDEPENGYRFNRNKLLIDPYAKAIAGVLNWNDALFGYEPGNPEGDLSFSKIDSAPFIPKCVVIEIPSTGKIRSPRRSLIINRSFTKRMSKDLHNSILTSWIHIKMASMNSIRFTRLKRC